MFRFFSVAVYLKIIRGGSSESVNNQGELIGPQSDLKWPARPLYLHFPLFYSICTIYIFNKVQFTFPLNTIIIFQPSVFQDFSRIFHGMEELCYISKRFLCPDGTFVLQRDIEYWKSLTTSKGPGTYQDSKAFQINSHYFCDCDFCESSKVFHFVVGISCPEQMSVIFIDGKPLILC